MLFALLVQWWFFNPDTFVPGRYFHIKVFSGLLKRPSVQKRKSVPALIVRISEISGLSEPGLTNHHCTTKPCFLYDKNKMILWNNNIFWNTWKYCRLLIFTVNPFWLAKSRNSAGVNFCTRCLQTTTITWHLHAPVRCYGQTGKVPLHKVKCRVLTEQQKK